MSLKCAYYLTDCSKPGCGNTWIIPGSMVGLLEPDVSFAFAATRFAFFAHESVAAHLVLTDHRRSYPMFFPSAQSLRSLLACDDRKQILLEGPTHSFPKITPARMGSLQELFLSLYQPTAA
eukprot:SAG31_NODE_1611_length_7748_cov_2.128758_5_plen_121_part_00